MKKKQLFKSYLNVIYMGLKDYMNVHMPFVSHAVLYSDPNITQKAIKILKIKLIT